jgi:two-component system chemotaxis response regulator CheY
LTEDNIPAQDSTRYSNPILIIEDSLAIAMRIEEFLTTLGYYNIHISNLGKEGIQQFKDIEKSGKTPFVCLDYNLPDMDANIVLPKLLEIQPDAKVIIITAVDRNDQAIKDVIMNGAYFYLQKPVRLTNLQEIMKILEQERLATENKNFETNRLIQAILSSSSISLNKICELCKIRPERALTFLNKLEVEGDVIGLENIKEISCNQCGSVLVKKDNQDSSTDSEFSCSRCKAKFRASQAKWITSKAFRLKVKLKLDHKTKF